MSHIPLLVDSKWVQVHPDARIVDLRWTARGPPSRQKYEEGHIPGAQHIFLGDLTGATEELPRDRPLVIACQGGSRSSIGASMLRARGFTNVINFSGGFTEWQRAGLPVETADATAPSP